MKAEQIKTEGDECIQDQKIFSKVAIKDRTGSIFLNKTYTKRRFSSNSVIIL